MFRNNLKIAWRSLLKDRKFSVLNILGLSAGLACTLLIYLWVNDELSFDKFLTDDNQVYELMEGRSGGGTKSISDESSGLVSKTVLAQDPDVEYAAPLAPPSWFQKFTLSVGDNNIKAAGQYAGKDYFNIFSFKLLQGKPSELLQDKNSIVISNELAEKLFGQSSNVMGKHIRFQQQQDFFVSGVFEKLPSHSSQQFDFVLSFDYMASIQPWVYDWYNTGPHNFIKLKKGVDINAFNKRISGLITANTTDTTRTLVAQKFSDIYINNTFDHGAITGSKVEYVKLFSLIAVFILLIACINFMNLSTAKASRRMKEVGVKKVVGANRPQLIAQFLSESILLTIIAMVFAIAIAWLLLPAFNQLTGKEITMHFSLQLITMLVAILLVTGLLAGSYPAFYLSKFNPLAILKGKFVSSVAEAVSRKGLVVFQFTLSAMLIVAVMVIYNQIQYIQSADPGYVKENIIRFNSEGKLLGAEDRFAQQIKQLPGVVNASFTFNNMVGRNFGTGGLDWEGKYATDDIYFEGFGGGFDFIPTMGMKVVEGRNFSRDFGGDTSSIILNQAAVNVMHLKNPVGKTIKLFNQPKRIIGIVKDFHFESLHETVKPAYMVLAPEGSGTWLKLMVRIKAGNQSETIASIKNLYEKYNTGFPFTFEFLDGVYQKQYDTEQRVAILSRYFAGLAILISCLGLFGLAAFTAEKRRKEISIRKVIGASSGTIIALLSKDFLQLVVASLLLAFPLSWWLMNNWLQGFAYHINIGFMVFFVTAAFVLVITVCTISFQSIRASMANPAIALKSE